MDHGERARSEHFLGGVLGGGIVVVPTQREPSTGWLEVEVEVQGSMMVAKEEGA